MKVTGSPPERLAQAAGQETGDRAPPAAPPPAPAPPAPATGAAGPSRLISARHLSGIPRSTRFHEAPHGHQLREVLHAHHHRARHLRGRLAAAGHLLPDGQELEIAWLALWLMCLAAIIAYPRYLVIPFDTIWVTLALLYAVRLWRAPRMLVFLGAAALGTAIAIDDDVTRHFTAAGSLGQLPLLAAFFLAVFWLAQRKAASKQRAALDAEAERLLASQRQFLQDASHQLRTPITIALGHAELLAGELAERQQRDIHVVVGELERLKALSERLLLVAASENPEFLNLEPIWLAELAVQLRHRWAATAGGRLVTGRLDPVLVLADAERLGLALDALVENALRHTRPDGTVVVSVVSSGQPPGRIASVVVADDGDGIDEPELPHIFARFRSGGSGARTRPGGTGLGLALVQAIARGHGGEARVSSTLGAGSTFEIAIPAAQAQTELEI